jgi:peptidoglycan/xylan/chitin deacetylase (PgdA/CDA1 family)
MLTKAARLLALAGAAVASPLAARDANTSPANLDRRAVPVGTVITHCTQPGVVALTFDDGPFAYTDQALNLLNNAGFKATFFMNGDNWDSIYNRQSTVRAVYNGGHQVGSHTWSHADLGTLDYNGVSNQLTMLEDAFVDIIGVYPTYLRPPYLSMSSTALSAAGALGYHVISVDIDTIDWNLQGNIAAAHTNFVNGLNAGGNLVLAHDVHQNTVQQLLPMLINTIRARGLRAVTVGECLGDPASNWYAPARGGSNPGTPTNPPTNPTGLPISTDATCGADAGYRCPAGNCCSQYGWCGTSSAHCGAGCQIAYGICS